MGHISLGADDWLDPLREASPIEVDNPVHVAVVGHSQRRLPVGRGCLDQIAHPGGAVED